MDLKDRLILSSFDHWDHQSMRRVDCNCNIVISLNHIFLDVSHFIGLWVHIDVQMRVFSQGKRNGFDEEGKHCEFWICLFKACS